MSPMLDLPQRYQDVFRIRLGDQEGPPDRYGKPTPQAFTDQIRVTAPTREPVEAFAEVYGGEVQPWASDRTNDEWQVYLPVRQLKVWLIPGQSLEAWWELYKKKVCDRRCDGIREQHSGQLCKDMQPACPRDPKERTETRGACSPMTRLSVVCPEVGVLGAGSLVTHSLIAAETLPAALRLASRWLSKGIPVEAVLSTYTHNGRTTFTFPTVVPLGPPANYEGQLPAAAEIPALGPPSPGQGQRGDQPAALEAGAARQEDSATSAVPPPADDSRRPFDESDAVLFGLEGERWLVGLCRENGLSEDDIGEIVMAASAGRTGLAALLYKSEKDAAKRAFAAAVAARPSEPVEVVG